METITEYPNIDKMLIELRDAMQKCLGDDLLGLYLSGSLTTGDFDPGVSDIDLLAVVENVMSTAQLERLKQLHADFIKRHPAWDDRIETAYMSPFALANYRERDCEVANISPGEPLHLTRTSSYWLIEFFVVQQIGVTLLGPNPSQYIPHITPEDFVRTVKDYFTDWPTRAQSATTRGAQAYVILTLCRNLYAITNGKYTSKTKGAQWAIAKYPEWGSLIGDALQWRRQSRGENPEDPATLEEVKRFTDFAVAQSVRR
jgi:predicted nucleotidyltransferase